MHATIAVSRKCCYCCNLLCKLFDDQLGKKFDLVGTHGRVYPWMPPAGLDLRILEKMKAKLIVELQKAVGRKRVSNTKKQDELLSSPASSYGVGRRDTLIIDNFFFPESGDETW